MFTLPADHLGYGNRMSEEKREEYFKEREAGRIAEERIYKVIALSVLYQMFIEGSPKMDRDQINVVRQWWDINDDYEREILEVFKRHPNYSGTHIARKILYECSYLPCDSKNDNNK